MEALQKRIGVSDFLCPKRTELNQNTNLLKIVAMITMLFDHAGKMLFPQYRVMRFIGRIAFPIYAYCIAVGCIYTRDMFRYLKRIVMLALISQPIYAVALAHTSPAMYTVPFSQNPPLAIINFYFNCWSHPSVLISLTVGILILWSLKEKQYLITLALAVLVWRAQGSLDYGYRGVLLMVLFYLFSFRWWAALPIIGAYMAWWGLNGGGCSIFGIQCSSQMYALAALPLICAPMRSRLKLNKWVFYVYYPAHMILIFLLDKFVF